MRLKHRLQFRSDANVAMTKDFRATIEAAHKMVFSHLVTEEIESTKVVAVLALDFTAAVEKVFDSMSTNAALRSPYTIDRLGGEVVAKTMSLNAESSEIHIIFNAKQWVVGNGNDICFVYNLRTATHEMVHAALARIRWQSGLL